MLTPKRSLLAVALGIATSMSFAQETDVEVEIERVRTLSADQDKREAVPETIIDLYISMPSIAGLGDSARVTRLEDDQGKSLLRSGSQLVESHGFDPGESGYLLRHQMVVNSEEGWLRVPVYAPEVPEEGAETGILEMDLTLQVVEGSQQSVVDNLDFSDIPAWGMDIEVAGHIVNCRDERRTRPDDQPLELYCFIREGTLLDVKADGSSTDYEITNDRANLVIEGERTGVDVTFELPVTRTIERSLRREFAWN